MVSDETAFDPLHLWSGSSAYYDIFPSTSDPFSCHRKDADPGYIDDQTLIVDRRILRLGPSVPVSSVVSGMNPTCLRNSRDAGRVLLRSTYSTIYFLAEDKVSVVIRRLTLSISTVPVQLHMKP